MHMHKVSLGFLSRRDRRYDSCDAALLIVLEKFLVVKAEANQPV
jgi:hypothetical protein